MTRLFSMLINTNIGQVIARLKRLDEAVPQALRKAADPGYWRPRLESVALKTIRAQWALEPNIALREIYERVTGKVMASIVAEVFDRGTYFRMSMPEPANPSPINLPAAASFNIEQRTPSGRIKKDVIQQGVYYPELIDQEGVQNLERVRHIVRDWVMLEKNRDARDYKADGTPLSDEELAERVSAILGIGRSGVIPRERTQTVQDAAESLARAIQRWLDGEGDSPPVNYDARTTSHLSPEVAAQWLHAVLLAWQKFMLAALPGNISFQLNKVFQSIQKELI
jgi:hypothetical protein